MRHGRKINHLSRKANHRKSMLANMTCSLIIHKRINTTVAKAKALRKYAEPLLTKSKVDSTASRRLVFSYLNDKETVTMLFRDVAVKIADRPGGYTRIIKTGNRLGDNAEMCLIELVDFNELMLADKAPKKAAKATTRRGKKKATTDSKEKEEGAEETTAEDKPKKKTAAPKDAIEKKKESIKDQQDVNAEPTPKQVHSHTHEKSVERKTDSTMSNTGKKHQNDPDKDGAK